MCKVILMMVLVVMSSSAMAEWVEVSSFPGGWIIFYADPSTSRASKNGNKVEIWSLTNINGGVGKGERLSEKSLFQFDCKEKKSRIIKFDSYEGRMGTGNIISKWENQNSQWEIVEPRTTRGELLKFACRSTLGKLTDKLTDKAKAWIDWNL